MSDNLATRNLIALRLLRAPPPDMSAFAVTYRDLGLVLDTADYPRKNYLYSAVYIWRRIIYDNHVAMEDYGNLVYSARSAIGALQLSKDLKTDYDVVLREMLALLDAIDRGRRRVCVIS